MVREGDRVSVTTDDGETVGTLMPSQKETLTVIKLDTGYNKGINKKRIKQIAVIEPYQPKAEKVQDAPPKTGLPTIAILHTGGTIASKVDYRTGGVVARFTPTELLDMFPELHDIANIRSRLISNMWSEDLRFGHYNLIAKAIEEEIKQGCKGVIITHGTDTLHYTAAALSFMFESLPVPVLLVGAQRSSDRGSSDAGMNLVCAARFITDSDFAEVAICMHNTTEDNDCAILQGTKVRKMHATRRDAFKSINVLPWAKVSYAEKTVSWLRTGWKRTNKSPPSHKPFKEDLKIAILKAHPHMRAEQVAWYKGYDAIILEGFGLGGHLPVNEIDPLTTENAKIGKELQTLTKAGTLVATTTQTIYGRVNMNVYSTGRDMKSWGIIGDHADMTAETAFIKIAFLLSTTTKEEAKALFSKDIRGEISARTIFEEQND